MEIRIMSNQETKQERRAKYLEKTLEHFLKNKIDGKNGFLVEQVFTLNNSLALKTIRFYVQSIDTLKNIYGVEELAEASKIAGLMAHAILRFRPLVPIGGNDICEEIEDSDCNELLAIYHGIDICSAGAGYDGGNIMMDFMATKKEWFDSWFKHFMYLVQEREYTSESLILIFETLCLAVFSKVNPDFKPLYTPS
jgi:hypothetical protein